MRREMNSKDKGTIMSKKKKRLLIIGILLCIISLIVIGKKLHNYMGILSIREDLGPLIILDNENSELIMHYFQDDKNAVRNSYPTEITPWPFAGSDIDQKNSTILLLGIVSDVVQYNYQTGEIQERCPYNKIDSLLDGYGMSELQFIPDSNNISFVGSNKVYLWQYDKEKYVEIYDYDDEYKRLGFAYEWKNDKELYMIKENNFVLHNIETKKDEILVENIGNVYFEMSDDDRYIAYQEQYGDRRPIIWLDLETGEKRQIHTAKSSYKVTTDFSLDGTYIFLWDHHRDNHLGKSYWYLYDVEQDKKIEVDIDLYSDYWDVIGW